MTERKTLKLPSPAPVGAAPADIAAIVAKLVAEHMGVNKPDDEDAPDKRRLKMILAALRRGRAPV